MENLPADIFIHHIFPLLCHRSINLGLTCKRLYQIYVRKRDRNIRIARRFERVNNKFNECRENGSGIGVTFDRMYNLHPYHESTNLIMFVKSYQPRDMDLSNVKLFLHYTLDQWHTVEREELKFVDCETRGPADAGVSCGDLKDPKGPLLEITWVIYFDAYSTKFQNIWFAIELIGEGDLHLWDNNNGWNYDVSAEHHWIPDHPVMEKYPLMGCSHGWYFPSEYASLNNWLYDYEDWVIS